jgi:amino acid transporter
MDTATPPPIALHRTLSAMEVVFLAFSALSPALSVFIYGDGILHMAGSGAAAAVLIGGVAAAITGLLYAELGAAFPEAGGLYPSLAGVLGPFWTFPYVTMMMVLAPMLIAFSALGFADYVRVLDHSLPQAPVAVVCVVLACALAVLRVRLGALITGAFLTIEAVALVVLVVIALLHPARGLGQTLTHPLTLDHGLLKPLTVAGLALAAVSSTAACAGANWAMYFGEEMRDAPRRIGPLIGWIGLFAALTIGAPLILVVLSASDLKAVLSADAPVAAYMTRSMGPGLTAVISSGLVIAFFNCIVATVMSFGRLFYATGRDGIWPAPLNRLLGKVDARTQSPLSATVIVSLLSLGLMLMGEQALLVLIANESTFEYLLMGVALLVGRRLGRTGAHFRAPLHPLVPLIGIAAAVAMIVAEWLDPAAGRPGLLLICGLFVVSWAYYRFRMNHPSRRWTPNAGEALDLS